LEQKIALVIDRVKKMASLAPIYLDHASTSEVDPQVAKVIYETMLHFSGNPSNLHKRGQEAGQILRKARSQIADCLGVDPVEIYFTASGSEANNWVMFSAANLYDRVMTSEIEHASLHFAFEEAKERSKLLSGAKPDFQTVSTSSSGEVDLLSLREQLHNTRTFVSLIAVNNETGVTLDFEGLKAIKEKSPFDFHTDATQVLGKIDLDFKNGLIDYATFSGHKIGAPKGIGFLYKKKNKTLKKWLLGGAQELGLRAGTENTPYIVGLALAVEKTLSDMQTKKAHFKTLSAHWKNLIQAVPNVVVNGTRERNSDAIFNFSVEGLDSDLLQIVLSQKGVYLSGGAACSSGSQMPSRVLKAMGLPSERIRSALRVSFSSQTTIEELQRAAKILQETVLSMQQKGK
jgi:cysteine desulfurase